MDTLIQANIKQDEPKSLYPGFYRRNIKRITRKIEGLLSLNQKFTLKQSGKFSGIFYPWLEMPIDNVVKEYFNIDDLGSITPAEKKDIYVVLVHMMKRSINGLRQFDDRSNKFGLSIKKSLDDKEFLSEIGGFLPIHDAIHGVCRYIKDPENTANDPKRFVPAPFRIKYTGSNDTSEIIEEEILASIWLPKQMKQNIARYTEGVNNGETMTFWEYCISIEYPNNPERKQPNYTELLDEIKRNPHPKLVEMLEYIWENRDNPRVLVDLFLKETRGLVEQLKRRKQYKKFQDV